MKEIAFNETKKPIRRSSPKGFDYGTVPLDDKVALQKHEAEFSSVARKDIEEIFAHAERLIDAKARLPKRYEEWVKKACKGISVGTAGNYTRAYERFHDRVAEIIELDIMPTHLYKMAKAPVPAIEEIFGRAAAGESVTGADITRIIKLHADPADNVDEPQPDRPLRKGLLAKLKPITEDAVDIWLDRLATLRNELLAALPNGKRTRVIKGDLEKTVMYDARWLGRELQRMTGFGFLNHGIPFGRPQPALLNWPDKDRWYQVSRALWRIGGIDKVAATELETCIRAELLPVLDWALGHATAEDHLGIVAGDGDEVDDDLGEDDALEGLDVACHAPSAARSEWQPSTPGE